MLRPSGNESDKEKREREARNTGTALGVAAGLITGMSIGLEQDKDGDINKNADEDENEDFGMTMQPEFSLLSLSIMKRVMQHTKMRICVENQKAIIDEYCRLHFPTSTVDYFEDRGKSGYTFEQRPDYMRMREKLMQREYNVLIIKDLSRFSRRTGKGLAGFEDLAERDIRIIAIGDGVDYYPDHINDWMKIKLYFFINEMPVTDTGRKVASLIIRAEVAPSGSSGPSSDVYADYEMVIFISLVLPDGTTLVLTSPICLGGEGELILSAPDAG